jgi:glutamine amidotransferase
MLGCVAREPTSLRHELVDAPAALLRAGGDGDSGWGMAVFPHADGDQPRCAHFPDTSAAGADEVAAVIDKPARIALAHVRRATTGALSDANTQPFCLGEYAFCHSGTIRGHDRLLGLPDGSGPQGQTDSERFFHRLLREVDPDPQLVVDGLRRAVAAAVRCGPLSSASFLFSDGERLYAYRLGLFELHWLARPGQVLVASDRVTDESWHDVRQDVLLVLDPAEEEPHAERLLGDELLAHVQFEPFADGSAERDSPARWFASGRPAGTSAPAAE